MRNYLDKRTAPEGAAYMASGDLDGNASSVFAYTGRRGGRFSLGIGPMSLSLSKEAITELAHCLNDALADLKALDDGKGGEA
ncbi:hypothetical protein [Azotobacter vinelandii]|uniref:hypothetical protein n=1 Tax=Azotobacter vinelandii TaxID=354 RepID=UPI000774AF46|nr:hypothetical protein [Azotobacter vinelandii]